MSSRLVVKNIPRTLTSEQLRKHFAKQGDVTDARVLYTADGRSRQFGFVGYRTEEEASRARKFFDKSYINTSRLTVETAMMVGDERIPRAWSRYTQGSSRHTRHEKWKDRCERELQEKNAKAIKRRKTAAEDQAEADEAKRKRTRHSVVLTANDETVVTKRANKAGELVRKSVPNVKRGGVGKKLTRTHIKFAGEEDRSENADDRDDDELLDRDDDYMLEAASSSDSDKASSTRRARSKGKKQNAHSVDESVDLDDAQEEELLDLMLLEPAESSDEEDDEQDDRQHDEEEQAQTKSSEQEDEDERERDDDQEDAQFARRDLTAEQLPVTASKKDEEANLPVPDLSETGRLFVRNLSFACSEKELQKLFGKVGRVVECEIVRDTRTGLSSGYGFVRFEQPQHAIQALARNDGRIFQGRLLHVLPARPERVADEDDEAAAAEQEENGRSRSFKAKKQAKERASAGSEGDERRWNALLVRADVAAAAAARAHGLSKGEVLDAREGDQAAVRQALAEAALIEECCTSLREQGVCLETLRRAALGGEAERSRTTLLAKNLPERADAEDLRLRFAVYGQVVRFAMPPSRAMALIEMADAGQARKAFRALAYSRYRDVPLYLEWAPESVFAEQEDGEESSSSFSSFSSSSSSSPVGVTGQSCVPVEEVIAGESADSFFFYRERNGRPIYLDPRSVKMLLHEYGSYRQLPRELSSDAVLELREHRQDAQLRRRYSYLAHLPLACSFSFATIDLSSVVSEKTALVFKNEVRRTRKLQHQLEASRRKQAERDLASAAAEEAERQCKIASCEADEHSEKTTPVERSSISLETGSQATISQKGAAAATANLHLPWGPSIASLDDFPDPATALAMPRAEKGRRRRFEDPGRRVVWGKPQASAVSVWNSTPRVTAASPSNRDVAESGKPSSTSSPSRQALLFTNSSRRRC